MKKIDDFGEKIGGSKKDLWAYFRELSEGEKNALAQKEAIWKRPNYKALLKEIPKEVLFWRNEVRKAVYPRPALGYSADGYVQVTIALRDRVEACKSMVDIRNFYKNFLNEFLVKDENDPTGTMWRYAKPEYNGYFNGDKLLRYVRNGKRIKTDCEESSFLMTQADKNALKYEILKVGEVKSEPSDDNMFCNHISLPGLKAMYCDTKDWSKLLPETEDHTLRIVCYDHQKIGLCFTDEEAEKLIADHKAKALKKDASKKEAFLPPHLSVIERTGSSYRYFRMSDPNVLSARYGLRGGEFGNYETSKDRLGSLNMTYDGLEDLANACGIKPKDIGLGGKLAIAFGARGRGNALAHYEPERNVINLTRMRGAGSLAHEWGHALDMYLGMQYGCPGFVSNNIGNAPDAVKELIGSMESQNGEQTAFFKGSKEFDKRFQKSGNGYWSSKHEMFARAFACFVRDQLGDRKSDFLIGHSECAAINGLSAIPMGEERKVINKNFLNLFSMLIDTGVFSAAEKRKEEETVSDVIPELFVGEDGQLKFC